jgi:hypothetical protein
VERGYVCIHACTVNGQAENGFVYYFNQTGSAQIMFNVDKAHMILDEMIMNGQITETNRNRILAPVAVLEKSVK